METAFDPNYIAARETLRDAVEALRPHRNAVILVGAQAVYVHTESADESFAVAPFTYDADIALDPELLEDSPALIAAMSRAGFRLHNPPGLYKRDSGGQVDLLVPHAVGGSGRRGARLGGHGNEAARQVHGLEGVLVSHTRRRIGSLVAGAARSCILKVAGPAALLVSKVHKLEERLEAPAHRQRQLPKDAFDIYRLLRAIGTAELAEEFRLLQGARDFEPCDLAGAVEVSGPVRCSVRQGSGALGQLCRAFGGPRFHRRVECCPQPGPAGGARTIATNTAVAIHGGGARLDVDEIDRPPLADLIRDFGVHRGLPKGA